MIKFYGITCRGCEDRFIETEKHCNEKGVDVNWIRGINGKISGVSTINNYTYHDPESDEKISSGHVSLVVNHWFAWNLAFSDYCEVSVFIEDDCRFLDSFTVGKLREVIEGLNNHDNEWEMLYVGHWEGSSHPNAKGYCYDTIIGQVATLKSCPFGTHCYAVKTSALPKIIDACERIYAPIDVALWVESGPLLRQYACVPPLARQEVNGDTYKETLSYSIHKKLFESHDT